MNDKPAKPKAAPSGQAQRRPARAELVWEGKYDEHGRRVAPLRAVLPFQTVETVYESAQDRQKNLLLAPGFGEEEWRNRLIWGDKKYVLPSLLPEFAGKVNLIYIDPPFDTGADFSFTATVPPRSEDAGDSLSFIKEASLIEQKAYRDTWGRGLDSYLQWFFESSVLLHELLHEEGSIFVHLDWHVVHYARAVLDEVFGADKFRNEIAWHYLRWPAKSPLFQRSHDTLLWYGKSDAHSWNQQYQELSEATLKRFGGKKVRGETTKIVLDEESLGAPMRDVWDIPHVLGANPERNGYPTQKPEALLERVVYGVSNAGDLVLDCFVGSGTTAAVAEKLGRRWIACDLGRFAIHTTRKRLLSIPNVRPFIVQNLGKYERQVWAGAEFGSNGKAAERQRAYIEFILKLDQAMPIHGYNWLHGLKAGRMVHVGSVDALGWDFAFEVNEVARQQAAAANIRMRFLRIPRDVMDKRAVDEGDIRFFELAALAVDVKNEKRNVHLRLTDFVIPPDDVPEEARKAVKHWSQWIDYWAVDWDNKGDTFHNEWQAYRTRKDKALPLEIRHAYAQPGEYRIVVKVIDILGNDTTKTVKVAVK